MRLSLIYSLQGEQKDKQNDLKQNFKIVRWERTLLNLVFLTLNKIPPTWSPRLTLLFMSFHLRSTALLYNPISDTAFLWELVPFKEHAPHPALFWEALQLSWQPACGVTTTVQYPHTCSLFQRFPLSPAWTGVVECVSSLALSPLPRGGGLLLWPSAGWNFLCWLLRYSPFWVALHSLSFLTVFPDPDSPYLPS